MNVEAHLDIALNTIHLLRDEVQQLQDEISILKGQKLRPKIPASALEEDKSKDKENDQDKPSRGKHPRGKKNQKAQDR